MGRWLQLTAAGARLLWELVVCAVFLDSSLASHIFFAIHSLEAGWSIRRTPHTSIDADGPEDGPEDDGRPS